MKLLLVEDEKRMSEALCEILRQEKYDVDAFSDGISGLDAARSGIYDLLILDVMLPGINGFDIARTSRKEGIQTPILMLTAKADTDDKVIGLDSGADDYLTKPFETKELLARVRALLRRNNIQNTDDTGNLISGDLKLDRSRSLLINTQSGTDVRLSEKELHIMEIFLANKGAIVSKEQLAVKIWGFDNEAEYNNVEVYISFTRKKLQFLGSMMEIKAVRGLGYELRKKAYEWLRSLGTDYFQLHDVRSLLRSWVLLRLFFLEPCLLSQLQLTMRFTGMISGSWKYFLMIT